MRLISLRMSFKMPQTHQFITKSVLGHDSKSLCGGLGVALGVSMAASTGSDGLSISAVGLIDINGEPLLAGFAFDSDRQQLGSEVL